MIRKEFEIKIDAPKEKVWNVLWNDATYRQWTAPFSEGSYAETDWKEGSKVKFIGPDGNGMVSIIKKSTPNAYMSIEHQGFLINDVEDTQSDGAKIWQGAMENYTLRDTGGNTELLIESDITEEYLETFEKAWPAALQKVKELSEKA